MQLSLIVAVSRNLAIGRQGQLPWRLSADLQRFKNLTMGHTIVMGRKTYESIGRLLPGRTTVVVTRQPDYRVPGGHVVHRLEDALSQFADDDDEIFIIGGGEIYRLALPLVDRIYLTRVDTEIDGDAFFPAITGDWQEISHDEFPADGKNEFAHSFSILERTPPSAN